MLLIGVDPGLTGAMACICTRRGLLSIADLPTEGNGLATGSMRRWLDAGCLLGMLTEWSAAYGFAEEDALAVVERPIPMPSLPAQTVGGQFDALGVIRTALVAKLGAAKLRIAEPRVWKKAFGLRTDKDESIACALRLYPEASRYLVRKKHHNRAEAVLLAHWLRREVE